METVQNGCVRCAVFAASWGSTGSLISSGGGRDGKGETEREGGGKAREVGGEGGQRKPRHRRGCAPGSWDERHERLRSLQRRRYGRRSLARFERARASRVRVRE